ncbi:hypothetical protein C7447_10188 [Tenacibaculum adriaticum]|uniref:Uncharacterized protein n=1 Tax=Tenacibaculum adriaticum TaxID=413713 RepID=A0A5S5DW34_9FLAO|nr:hypothetical protein [Tenacibaculum adriaticum]TYP99488.1 hypothetical protein C7447_10188 [Tenacibaculum adriaticum]
MRFLKSIFLVFSISVILLGCNALKTAVFDQYSYQKSIEIKIEALKLMEKATEQYQQYSNEVDELELEIEKIVAYEKYKPNNEVTYKMWLLLSDKDKNLLAGFFKRWKEKEKLSSYFIEEAKKINEEAMDLLIQYEAKKEPEFKARLLDIISKN